MARASAGSIGIGRWFFRHLFASRTPATPFSGCTFRCCLLCLLRLLLRSVRCHAHVVHEIGIATACPPGPALRFGLLSWRKMLGRLARALARVGSLPGCGCCSCHPDPTPDRIEGFPPHLRKPATSPAAFRLASTSHPTESPHRFGGGYPVRDRRYLYGRDRPRPVARSLGEDARRGLCSRVRRLGGYTALVVPA